jgi:hypothetical protein
MKQDEGFCKLSRRDMQRMWRTLKAESGSHPIVRPYPGVETHTLRYWMDLMEERLATEVASRPPLWKRWVSRLKRKLKWT